jgi:long-chain acyl-CoA synthetase
MNLGTYLDDAVERYGDRPLFRFHDQTVTYGEFGQRVDRLAAGLRELGFGKGDIIHVYAENDPDVVASYFAIQKIGAIAGPINNWWKADEVKYLLNDSGGRGLIVGPQFLDTLAEIRPRCPDLETVIELGDSPRSGHVAFERLIADNADADHEPARCDCEPGDSAYIFYTSGTTGDPKGVLLSHRNVLADVEGISEALSLQEGMTVLCFLPLFHVNAMLTCVFSVRGGFQIVLRKGFSAGEFWEVVDRFKVNFWSAVPAVYQILLTDPGRQKYDLSSLQFGVCGAAPLTAETKQRFEETFGIPIVEGYGLTEATCVSTINPRDGVRKVGSIGLPLPGQDVRVVDEGGDELPAGHAGEIIIGGDVVMKGYHNRPEETHEAIVDGFLRTGDIGYRDEEGYIFIVDRKKDVVIRGGENIYPKEIDNLLATHPRIAEAAAIGVPDETMGEEVKVFVIAADDSLTEDDVLAFCREKLADYKVPRHVEILEEDFPRNAIGKVMKKVLKQWGTTPRPKKKKSAASVPHIFGTMEARVRPDKVEGITANYGYNITGDGGGKWTVAVADGAVKVTEGLHDPHVTTTMSASDFIDLNLGKLDGMTAFTAGKIKAEGDVSLLMKAPKFFTRYEPPRPAPEATVDHIFGTMEARVRPDKLEGITANYGYSITGDGGGEWTVSVKDGALEVLEGIHDPHVTTTMSASDFVDLNLGKLDGMAAFTSGKIKAEGDVSLLMKATKFFTRYEPPRPEPEVTVADIFGTMEARVRPDGVEGITASYGYRVTGDGGGEWTVSVKDGVVKVLEGIHDPDVTTTVTAKDWIAITLGKLDGMTAFTSGRLKVEGEMGLLTKATRFFKKYTPPGAEGEPEKKAEELVVLRQLLSIPQRFSTGPLMGKFLKTLRDEKRILANRCPVCRRMQTPPREVCAVCRVRVDELVEVGPEGSVSNIDVAYYASPDPLTGESRETPYISAFLLLDGCSGNDIFWHEINPAHIDRAHIGARVRPVWAEERTGAITDILYFDVID